MLRFILFCGALWLAACQPHQQDTSTLSIVNLEIATSTVESGADGINPLTGLPVDDPDTLERRPIVVKISNAPALVRPQAGISQADLVFEHYAEGGLTRFSAVFYSQAPQRVGSIRSARLIDHEIVPMMDGILAFSGASLGVEKYIYGSAYVNTFYADIDGIEDVYPGAPQPPSEYAERAYKGVLYGPPVYWRDETIPAPHNMFVNLQALWEQAEADGHATQPRLTGLNFDDTTPPIESDSASVIDVRYRGTRIGWTYDPETRTYTRAADGLPHTDANTDAVIRADNVVILHAEHTETLVVESRFEGNPIWSIQIAVWGENDATLFREGRRYEARWTRTVREAIISLRTPDGDILPLKPGTTWFQVMPSRDQLNPENEWIESE
jgi:hypothetical protein